MSRPISETPILTGNDAKRFIERMEKSKTEKVSKEVRERMQRNYEALKAIDRSGLY